MKRLVASFLLLAAFSQQFAGAQSTQVRQIPTVAALISRVSIPGETLEVANYSTNVLWANPRAFTEYATTVFTNAHDGVHYITNARTASIYVSADRLATKQDLRWYGVDSGDEAATALAAANAHLSTLGGGTVEIPVSVLLSTAVQMSNNVFVHLTPSTTTINATGYTTASKPALFWKGSVGTPVALSANVLAATNKIPASGMSLSAGDYVILSNTNQFSGSPFRYYYYAGEFAQVVSYDGTNITTAERTRAGYSSATAKVWPVTLVTGGISGGRYTVAPDAIGPSAWYTADWYAKDIELEGSRNAHVTVGSSVYPRLSNIRIFDNTEPTQGLNYGLALGFVQGTTIEGCEITTKRHAITFGTAYTPPDGGALVPTMNYDNLITGNLLLQALESQAVDTHGNTKFTGIINNVIEGGIVVGGDHNTIVGNTRISNPQSGSAVSLTEPLGANFTMLGNTVKLGKIAGYTWGIAASFPNVESQYQGNTNQWTGDVANGDSVFTVRGNHFIVDGALLCDACLLGYFGEPSGATQLTNNTPWTVARVDISENTADIDTLPAGYRTYAFQILPKAGLRIAELRYRGNNFGQLGVSIANNGGQIDITGNFLRNATGGNGDYAPFGITDTVLKLPGVLNIDDNTFSGTLTNVIPVIVNAFTGNMRFSNNRLTDWGGSYGLYVSSTTITNLDLLGNVYEATTGSKTAVNITAANAALNDKWNRFRSVGAGTVTEGSITVGSTIKLRDEAAITSLNRRFSATSTPSWNVEGALTASSGHVTNTLHALDFAGRTLTLGNVFYTPETTFPDVIYGYGGGSDATIRAIMQNANTGASAHAGYNMSAVGVGGSLLAVTTNNAGGNLKGRMLLQSSTGNGITYDVSAADKDFIWTYGSGTEIARMSTNEFLLTLPNLTMYSGRSISLGGRAITAWLTNIADISGLQTALDGKQPLDADLTVIAAASGASNLVTSGDYAGHYHSTDRNRTNHTGTQAISTVDGLQTALDGKQATNANLTTLATLNGSILTNLNGTEIRSGTVAEARIDSAIARDAEVAAAYQPLAPYLTDLAGMTGLAGTIPMFDGTDLTGLGLGTNGQIAVATNASPWIVYRTPGTAAWRDVPPSGDATSAQAVLGSDTRLTDARTPSAHTHPASEISDSTAAGRTLLTAATAAAQRTALGLGDMALYHDAPTNANAYVRSNGAWAIAGTGGGTAVLVNGTNVTNPNFRRFFGISDSTNVDLLLSAGTGITFTTNSGVLTISSSGSSTNSVGVLLTGWVSFTNSPAGTITGWSSNTVTLATNYTGVASTIAVGVQHALNRIPDVILISATHVSGSGETANDYVINGTVTTNEFQVMMHGASADLRRLEFTLLSTNTSSGSSGTITVDSQTVTNIASSSTITNVVSGQTATISTVFPQWTYYTNAGNYDWTKPAGAKTVSVWMMGGGGGGGSGRLSATNVAASGGGGGGAGGYTEWIGDASSISNVIAVQVGDGGVGGEAQTTNTSNGLAGASGTNSFFTVNRSGGLSKPAAGGGVGGTGGTTSSASGGGGNGGMQNGGNGGAGNVTAGTAGGTVVAPYWAPAGGGGGGGVSSTNVAFNGGSGPSMHYWIIGGSSTLSGATAPGGNGATNTTASSYISISPRMPGGGGAGGAGHDAGNGGKGGDGSLFGAGGAGGGGARDGYQSGAGGNGARGYVIIRVD